jgi:hypothetical protein
MASFDIAFRLTRARQWVARQVGWQERGFEDELERQIDGLAKREFGMEVIS